MKIHGSIKNLDAHGRIIIPTGTLRAIGLDPGDVVEILAGVDPEGLPSVIIRKHHHSCTLCGDILHNMDWPEVCGKPLCPTCVRVIQDIPKNHRSL